MKNGTEKMAALMAGPVYLDGDEIAVRTEPGENWEGIKWFAKLKGGKEFPTEPSAKNVFDARNAWNEITAEKYKAF